MTKKPTSKSTERPFEPRGGGQTLTIKTNGSSSGKRNGGFWGALG